MSGFIIVTRMGCLRSEIVNGNWSTDLLDATRDGRLLGREHSLNRVKQEAKRAVKIAGRLGRLV